MSNAKKSKTFWADLLSFQPYKRSQGRLVRQATTAGIALVSLLGCYSLSQGPLIDTGKIIQTGVPTVLFLVGLVLAFRVVHTTTFADFLISVQGELGKVSWPSKQELHTSTIVVVVTMFFLGGLLLLFDMGWWYIMTQTGVLKS